MGWGWGEYEPRIEVILKNVKKVGGGGIRCVVGIQGGYEPKIEEILKNYAKRKKSGGSGREEVMVDVNQELK